MKGREWERWVRQNVLPSLPGFRARGRLLYAEPVDHVLQAFFGDPSAYTRDRVFVDVFAFPLYVPSEDLYFNIGRRLGGGSNFFDIPDEGPDRLVRLMLEEGLPFLAAHHSPELIADREHRKQKADLRSLELEAYSRLLSGDEPRARRRLIEAAARTPERDWEVAMQGRCRQILQLLGDGMKHALARLDEWEEESKRNLRLDGGRGPIE